MSLNRQAAGPRRAVAAARSLLAALCLAGVCAVQAAELPEFRVKAAFLYNFMLFTDWPAEVGPTLQLCVLGTDPFGPEIDAYEGKGVGNRTLTVTRVADAQRVKGCHLVYISTSAMASLSKVLDRLKGSAALSVADSPDAARQGVALNMVLVQSRVAFEVNRKAVQDAGLTLSSKLLRLAREVF